MAEYKFEFDGRDITPLEYYQIGESIKRSEALWEISNRELLERIRSQPLPPITINGRSWNEWKPIIRR